MNLRRTVLLAVVFVAGAATTASASARTARARAARDRARIEHGTYAGSVTTQAGRGPATSALATVRFDRRGDRLVTTMTFPAADGSGPVTTIASGQIVREGPNRRGERAITTRLAGPAFDRMLGAAGRAGTAIPGKGLRFARLRGTGTSTITFGRDGSMRLAARYDLRGEVDLRGLERRMIPAGMLAELERMTVTSTARLTPAHQLVRP